jgi:hypothetical protein
MVLCDAIGDAGPGRRAADDVVLERIERQLHASLALGSRSRQLGAFKLFVWPTPDPHYRNAAVPTAKPARWAAAIAELLTAFMAEGRPPRLEFFVERWPGLREALEAAGLEVQLEAPVMAIENPPSPTALLRLPQGTLMRLKGHESNDALFAILAAAGSAFGETATASRGEMAVLRQRLRADQIRAAVLWDDGAPVAGASLVGTGPVRELAGVWTRPDRRRTGAAMRCCLNLIEGFFNSGGELAWLSAGSPASAALYARLGFHRIGTQLDMAAKQPPSQRR